MCRCIGIFLISLITISGCAYYSKMAVPANPADQDKLQLIDHVKNEGIGIRLFMMIGGVPSVMKLVNESVAQSNGDGIVNLEVTFQELLFGPLSFPKVTIEGDVVRLRSHEIKETKSIEPDATPQKIIDTPAPATIIEPPAKTEPVPLSSIAVWKKGLLKTYDNSSIRNGWAQYQKNTGQKIKFKDWVNNLTDENYEDYQASRADESAWILNKWKEEQTMIKK